MASGQCYTKGMPSVPTSGAFDFGPECGELVYRDGDFYQNVAGAPQPPEFRKTEELMETVKRKETLYPCSTTTTANE